MRNTGSGPTDVGPHLKGVVIMARKTWPIEDLKKRANRYMRNPQLSREEKDIIQGFISDILYHAGQYKGFGYIEWSKDGGCQRWMDDG